MRSKSMILTIFWRVRTCAQTGQRVRGMPGRMDQSYATNFKRVRTALHYIVYFSPQISNGLYCATLHNIVPYLGGFANISDASLDSSKSIV